MTDTNPGLMVEMGKGLAAIWLRPSCCRETTAW